MDTLSDLLMLVCTLLFLLGLFIMGVVILLGALIYYSIETCISKYLTRSRDDENGRRVSFRN